VPAVRNTYPGLLDVAPAATEFIALLIAVWALPDVGFTVICAPNTQGTAVKLRHVTRNRAPSCLLNIISPLGWISEGFKKSKF
jgi:hypothetical protein